MPKTILTPAEASQLILAAYKMIETGSTERFLQIVERLILDHLFSSAEQERLLGLSK